MYQDPPVAYSIHKGGFRLDIALVYITKLLLHEKIIPEVLESLTKQIEEDGVQKDPVIAARESFIVLDGMHRIHALKNLGCRFACVCFVDYRNREIEIKRWCRSISKPFDEKKAFEVVNELNLKLATHSSSIGSGKQESYFEMWFAENVYEVSAFCSDFLSTLEAFRMLEAKLRALGFNIVYETEEEAQEKLKTGVVSGIIYPPKIGKGQVVELARKRHLLPSKSTRHIIPSRPLGVDVSLSLLKDTAIRVEEANRRLSEILGKKELVYEPSGIGYDGRNYEEGIHILK